MSRVLTEKPNDDDKILDSALRPKNWSDYVGQEKIKENIRIILTAAKQRGQSPDHLLLYGSSGLGKTTLAHLVALEMGKQIRVTSGPAIERAGDLAAILTNLSEGDVLFIDECLEENTLITLTDGTFKKINEIKNGDLVEGGRVSSFFKKTVSSTIKIKTSFNSIECSKTHPCIVNRDGKIKTVPAKNVKKTDYFLIPTLSPHTVKNNLSPIQAKFLALILCDGHIAKDNYTIQVETSKDMPLVKKIFEEGIKSFDLSNVPKNKIGAPRKTDPKHTLKITKRETQLLRIHSKNLAEKLFSLGIPSGKKHSIEAPPKIFTAPIESVRAFIDICFCCEGWVINSKNGMDVRLMIDMISKPFIQQLQLLLKKFGIHSSFYIRKRKGLNDMYRLVVSGNDLKMFYEKIGLSYPRKLEVLRQICNSPHILKPDLIPLPRFSVNNKFVFTRISRPMLENLLELSLDLKSRLDYRYEKIKSIEEIKERKNVYDFTTNKHTFIANGILTHNCHRINKTIEEYIYPAMEDYKLNLILGKGPMARTMELKLPKFTLIGATTRPGLLSSPLRSRFGATFQLNFYQQDNIEKIVERSAKILGLQIEPEAIKIIAKRSRFTPRVANRLLKRVRDFAQVEGDGLVTKEITDHALHFLEIDEMGLEHGDKRILLAIIEKFEGGPVGLQALAAASSEEEDTILDIYEPYLMQCGFIERTPKGRVASRLAYEHLNLKQKKKGSQNHLI